MTRRLVISVLLCCCTLSIVAHTPLLDMRRAKVLCYSLVGNPHVEDAERKSHLPYTSPIAAKSRSSYHLFDYYICSRQDNNAAMYIDAAELLYLTLCNTQTGKLKPRMLRTSAKVEILLTNARERNRWQKRHRHSVVRLAERRLTTGRKRFYNTEARFSFTNHLFKKGIISNSDSDADQEADHQA